MKIKFYVESFLVGGIEKVLLQYLKNIDSINNEVTLIIGYKQDELEKLKSDIPNNIKVEYVLTDDMYCALKKKKAIGKLSKLEKLKMEGTSWLRKIKIRSRLKELISSDDVIVDFDMTLSPFMKEFKNRKVTFCHFSLKNYHRGIERRLKKLGNRLNDYDKVVVISDEMKKEAMEMFPFLENKLVRIYNSFNFDEIYRLANKEIEKELEGKYILAIARLEETQKDFTTLIKAYSKICNEVEENLYIIGDGRHREQLENLVKELKVEDRVKFLGFRTNPYPYLKRANLFVHSSKFEGFGLVILEAMILGRMVIATDCPTGPSELLDNGKNGILVEVGNVDEMAESMKKVLINKEIQKEYLENAKKKLKEFDAKLVMKEFENIL